MKVIDIHVYFGKWYFPVPYKGITDILGIMASRNIEKAIMMSSQCIIEDFREGNETVFREIESHDSLYGYCYINGHYIKESMDEMTQYLPLSKCKGVKFHPEYSGKRPDDRDVIPLFEKLAHEYGKPALIHSWPYAEHGNATPNSHPRFLAELAKQIPELTIIMGHMGGPEWDEAIAIAEPLPNLYLDIGSSYTHFDKVKAAVDRLGAEHVLFGSGMTEGTVDTHLGVVQDSKITDGQKRIVLYEGAKKLFDL